MCRSLGCPKRVTPRTEERGGLGQPSPLRAGTEFLLQGSAGMGQGRGALTPTHGLGWPETRETQHFSHCPEQGQGGLEGFTRSFPHQLCTQTPANGRDFARVTKRSMRMKRGCRVGSWGTAGTCGGGCGKHPPSAGTGWSCSSAPRGSGTARAPPASQGGRRPPKPISERLLSPASRPSPLLATPHLGTKPGLNEHSEACPGRAGRAPRSEAGSSADFQAHPDGGRRAARRVLLRGTPQDATTAEQGCDGGGGSGEGCLRSCDSLGCSPG